MHLPVIPKIEFEKLSMRKSPLLANLLMKAFALSPDHKSLFSPRVKYDDQFLKESQIGHVS